MNKSPRTITYLLNSTPPGGKSKTRHLVNTCFSGHCQRLAPEYAKAAEKLAQQNPPLYVAKVDATEQKQLAERFAVKGFPTLLFFT